MSTFQVRVEDYLTAVVTDTTALTDQLTAGAKYLIDLMPEEKAIAHTTTGTDNGTTGVDVSASKVFGAYKSGYRAIPLNPDEYARYVDSNSRFFGTATTPVYYILNGTLFIKPGGGTARIIAYPTVLYSASSITGFPTEWEQAVVLYAAIQQVLSFLNYNTYLATNKDIELAQEERQRLQLQLEALEKQFKAILITIGIK